MRSLMLAFVLMGGMVWAEENPLAVKPDEVVIAEKEPVLDPRISKSEEEIIKGWLRKYRDRMVEDKDTKEYFAVKQQIMKRWGSGARYWTKADFDARVLVMKELVLLDPSQRNILLQNGSKYLIEFVAHKDDDPNAFIERMRLACQYNEIVPGSGNIFSYRKIVNEFLSQEKFTKATPQQKLAFVKNFVLPKMASPYAKDDLEGLVKDMREDMGLAPEEPKDTKKARKR